VTDQQFARRIAVTARDSNGELLKGVSISWSVNGTTVGGGIQSDGHCSIELHDASAVVAVTATYDGHTLGPVILAQGLDAYEFEFDLVIHPKWKQFFMKHFPAIIGIAFILLAVLLGFVYQAPTPLQTHILLGLFSIGGGGFGGEIAGFIKTDLTLGRKLAISAGGAAAIFVLLYFFVPAGTPQ
jgi:hypothetical protein